MAKTSAVRTAGNSSAHIRMFYFEAENVSGDLAGAIAALAHAIKSQAGTPHPQPETALQDARRTPQLSPPPSSLDPTIAGSSAAIEMPDVIPTGKPPRERKRFKGEIVDDIDWAGGGNSLDDFMKMKDPPDTIGRFLVIATWFKRYGGYDTVTANLVYNAYRKLQWKEQTDMAQPLRDGTRHGRGYFRSKGNGVYEVTNIGVDRVDKMGQPAPLVEE